MHGTSLLTIPDHFGPVVLPYVSINYDEECCFLKQFGFRMKLTASPFHMHGDTV